MFIEKKIYQVTISRSYLCVENTTIPVEATSEDEAWKLGEQMILNDPSVGNWSDTSELDYNYQVEEVESN